MQELAGIRLVTFTDAGTLRYLQPRQGEAWYPDINHLPEIAKSCLLGCIGWSASEMLQSSIASNVLWDLCIQAPAPSELGAKTFWQNAIKSTQQSLGVTPQQWLHVSGNQHGELAVIRELGLLPGLMPRHDSNAAHAAVTSQVPIMISDLQQLNYGLTSAKSQPVCFRVKAIATHKKIADEFVNWMRREHGPDLLKQDGCQEYRVLRQSPEIVVCEYLFSTRGMLDAYVELRAPALRARGRELFPEHLMTFERDVCAIENFGAQRSARDFC